MYSNGLEFRGMTEKNLWDTKKERREIVYLYNELRTEFNEIVRETNFIGKQDLIISPHKNSDCDIEFMSGQLEVLSYCIADCIYEEKVDFIPIQKSSYKDYLSFDKYSVSAKKDSLSAAKQLLLDFFQRNTLGCSTFDWITEKDERLVNYIWAFLRIAHEDNNSRVTTLSNPHRLISAADLEPMRRRRSVYDSLGLQVNPPSTKDKLTNIISFFDLWSVSLDCKRKQLKDFDDLWSKIKKDDRVFKYLEQYSNQILHVWAYVISAHADKIVPCWVNLSSLDERTKLKETKASIATFYDLLNSGSDKDRLLALMKKNAREKSFNDEHKEDLAQLNARISAEANEKLNRLVESKGKTKKRVLEDLIINEYNKLINNDKNELSTQ